MLSCSLIQIVAILKEAEMAIACDALLLLHVHSGLECSGQAINGVRHIESGAVFQTCSGSIY